MVSDQEFNQLKDRYLELKGGNEQVKVLLLSAVLILITLFILIHNYHIRELEVLEKTLQSEPYKKLEKRIEKLEERVGKE